MGGIVKSVKKAVKGVFKGVMKPVGSLLGAMTGGLAGAAEAPQVIQVPSAPQIQQSAVAMPDAPQVNPEIDTEGSGGGQAANRKGKKSLTVKRTPMGGGRGINM